ncbi:PilC/PilY family type IV pilus protein [Neisseria gonorrhoeae]
MNERDIKSREPNFNSRQTVIRLPGGVYRIAPGNSGKVAGFNDNDGKNDTFGIYKDRLVIPEPDEWSEVLLPWTARYYGNDDIFKTFNQPNNKKQSDKKQYSQKYRIRTKEDDNDKPRDLGDIVNSPITAVGGYLATAANDGMVHLFKRNGTDQRGYELKLSYIPGTMPPNILITTLPLSKTPTSPKSCAPLPKKAMWATATAWTAALSCAALQMTKTSKNISLCLVRWYRRQRRVCLGFKQNRQQQPDRRFHV